MRQGMLIPVALLLLTIGALRAQEPIPLPAMKPEPAPPPPLSPTVSESPPPPTPAPFPVDKIIVPPPASPTQIPGPVLPPPSNYPAPSPYPEPPPYFQRQFYTGDPRDPTAWIGIDTLIWWSKSQPLSVPLLTTGPASQGAAAGALGAPGTVSLNRPLDFGSEGGIRLYGGGWFDPTHTIGMDGSLLFLGRQTASYGAIDRSGTGNFVINEPVTGVPFVTQISAPGFATGDARVDATSDFWGGDVNVLFNTVRRTG